MQQQGRVDGATHLTVIDLQMQLPAGELTEWHIYNHRTASAPMKLQAWRALGGQASLAKGGVDPHEGARFGW